jgi:hypothetical protein
MIIIMLAVEEQLPNVVLKVPKERQGCLYSKFGNGTLMTGLSELEATGQVSKLLEAMPDLVAVSAQVDVHDLELLNVSVHYYLTNMMKPFTSAHEPG